MAILAHAGGWDEMLYALVPALIFVVVYRLVKGKPEPAEPQDPGASDADPARPTSPR